MQVSNLVSCIMSTYNRRAFVLRASEHFLSQDYAAKELIVVDDASEPIGNLVSYDERILRIRNHQRGQFYA